MVPFESLCLVDRDEVHRLPLISDDVGCGDIEVIGIDEREDLDRIMEYEKWFSMFVFPNSLDEGSHIRKMTGIGNIRSFMVQ